MLSLAKAKLAIPIACIAFGFGSLGTTITAASAEPLPAAQEKRVKVAIEKGIAYLGRIQRESGSWSSGTGLQTHHGSAERLWTVGYAALPGLTLLECGLPATNRRVQKVAQLVREKMQKQTRTYEISLAILFLDRLGEAQERDLIRTLALRLVAGQTHLGGWGYHCPVLKPAEENKHLELLRDWKPPDKPARLESEFPDRADNSNTQFAILALWVARKHDLSLGRTFFLVEQRFRSIQTPTGWEYIFRSTSHRSYGSMTCVGLLGLAVGCGSAKVIAAPEDAAITQGLRALANLMRNPTDYQGFIKVDASFGPKDALNYYFLWSVERVGVLLNLKTIGGKDWYRWGVDLILPEQKKDGSWVGCGSGGSPVIDTCFALLFLKKSDLLPDLRETLQKRLKIVDPGESSKSQSDKSENPPKSPGDKKPPEKKSSLSRNAIKTNGRLETPAFYAACGLATSVASETLLSSKSSTSPTVTSFSSSW